MFNFQSVELCVLLLFSSLAKKTQSVIQTLKKDGVLTTDLEQKLRSCRSVDELDHMVNIILMNICHLNIIKRSSRGVSVFCFCVDCSILPIRKAASSRKLAEPKHSGLTWLLLC